MHMPKRKFEIFEKSIYLIPSFLRSSTIRANWTNLTIFRFVWFFCFVFVFLLLFFLLLVFFVKLYKFRIYIHPGISPKYYLIVTLF